MRDVAITKWDSQATAADAKVSLGFVPDFAICIFDERGTNPNIRFWFNRARYTDWQAGADDSILMTGSSGVLTVDTASVAAYAGGDKVAAADVTAGTYYKRAFASTGYAAGDLTSAGLAIPAGDQVNAGHNTIVAFRSDI